ncbi:LysM-domain-containing protein [Thozetella sp. PMI_491]|nr:LysM-domain-containing protein [Thozetella sp. PMI_491]
MQYSTLLGMALGLASTAAAAPVAADKALSIFQKRAITGTNPGSLYSFADAASARQVFYTVGSCGLSTYFVGVVPDSMPLVAMPEAVFDKYGAAQHNTLCGKIITMTNAVNGVTLQAAVADRNAGAQGSIDMTIDLWTKFGQPSNDASQINVLNWSIADGTSSGGGSTGSCKQTYTVVSGDSCWAIWTKYGITEAQLRAWNPSLNSACLIQPGQVLCVSQ